MKVFSYIKLLNEETYKKQEYKKLVIKRYITYINDKSFKTSYLNYKYHGLIKGKYMYSYFHYNRTYWLRLSTIEFIKFNIIMFKIKNIKEIIALAKEIK